AQSAASVPATAKPQDLSSGKETPAEEPGSACWFEGNGAFAGARWEEAARQYEAALASTHRARDEPPGIAPDFETFIKAGVANLHALNLEKSREDFERARGVAGDMVELMLLLLQASCLKDPPAIADVEAMLERPFAKASGPERESLAAAVANAYMEIG